MGTVVTQDIFQSKLDSIFIGMEGVTGIADGMVIAGRDKMEHDRNFLAFMEKCMSNNLSTGKRSSSSSPRYLSMATAGQNTESHQIPRKFRQSYGVLTGQGNYEIFPRNDQLPQQVLCTQCTPHCTPQCTHTSGHRL